MKKAVLFFVLVFAAAAFARDGLVTEGVPGANVSGASSAPVATSVQDATSVPVATNPQSYRGCTRKLFKVFHANPDANPDFYRPIDVAEDDERWLGIVKNAKEIARDQRLEDMSLLIEAGIRLSGGRGDNADDLKWEHFRSEDTLPAGQIAKLLFFPKMTEAECFKATGVNSYEELGKKVLANIAMHVRSPEEISRFFSKKDLSEEDAVEYAQKFREMYNIPEEVSNDKDDAERYCKYYAQTRNAFYGFIAGRVADDGELRDAWALSLLKDDDAVTSMLVSLSAEDKSLPRFARVVGASQSIRAYSDKNWFTALTSGIWEGGKGAMRGIYTGAKDYFDKDFQAKERAKNWWAFVNDKILASGGTLGSQKEVLDKYAPMFPEWKKEFEEEEVEKGGNWLSQISMNISGTFLGTGFGNTQYDIDRMKAPMAEAERAQFAKMTTQDYIDLYKVADSVRRAEYAMGQYLNMEQDTFAPGSVGAAVYCGDGASYRAYVAVCGGGGDFTTSETERQFAANLCQSTPEKHG